MFDFGVKSRSTEVKAMRATQIAVRAGRLHEQRKRFHGVPYSSRTITLIETYHVSMKTVGKLR